MLINYMQINPCPLPFRSLILTTQIHLIYMPYILKTLFLYSKQLLQGARKKKINKIIFVITSLLICFSLWNFETDDALSHR